MSALRVVLVGVLLLALSLAGWAGDRVALVLLTVILVGWLAATPTTKFRR